MEVGTTIYVVDDDPGVRDALGSVCSLFDASVSCYSSAEGFLAEYHPTRPGCLILDIKLPGMTGLELQQRILQNRPSLPVIMISGHADVRLAVEVMRRGAITLLEKPFHLDELSTYIRQALELDGRQRASRIQQDQAESRLARLTSKEREVLELIAAGKTNKEMAASLQLSVRAVEDRRARLMKKLGANSLVDLVHFLSHRRVDGPVALEAG